MHNHRSFRNNLSPFKLTFLFMLPCESAEIVVEAHIYALLFRPHVSRVIIVQAVLTIAVLVYTEVSNCIMYIAPSSVSFDNRCMLICLIPMLTTTFVECRLFAYFSLLTERLRIINKSIDFYRNNLNSFSKAESHSADFDRMNTIRGKIFFINELVGSKKIDERVGVKTHNGSKSNFRAKLKSTTASLWRVIKNLLNFRQNRIFADDFEAVFESRVVENNYEARHYAERVCSMQIIYSKLYEISDLISKAYGIQIIAIISVQFITLTTLLYYCTMKIIRWEFVTQITLHR